MEIFLTKKNNNMCNQLRIIQKKMSLKDGCLKYLF